MGLFEPQHLIIILVIALLIFGPGKISELGGSLGRSVRDFKKAMAEEPEAAPTPAATPAKPAALQTESGTRETVAQAAATTKETA